MTQSTSPPIPIVPPAKVKFDPAERANEHGDLPIPVLKDPGKVECHDCRIFKPFHEFESGVDPICQDCRRTAAERELADVRCQQFNKVSKAVIDTANKGSNALPRLEFVFAEFMAYMGGERSFSMLWAEHFRIALTNRPGSHGNLQMFNAIAKVNLELSKRQQQESVLDLTDQQLRDRREMAQMKMLADILEDPGKVQLLLAAQRTTAQGIEDVPGVAEKMEAHDGATNEQ